jgi:membrane protein implicated in regulation of membrane protease activity
MAGLSWIEIIYWASTIIGGTLFIVRLITMFLGGEMEGGGLDTDLDAGGHEISGDHVGSDTNINLLSLQGLTSFFLMFGLVGLTLLKAGQPVWLTIVGGLVAGLITVALTGLVFSQMKRLQTEGTINIRNAIGQEGKVYLNIPQNGTGQVQVIVQGSLKIFDAVSKSRSTIATGETVEVVGVESGNTLVVEKAQ